MHDGALDGFSVDSDITWLDFQFLVAEKLLIPVADLNLGYKFTTDAQGRTPNALRSSIHFIEMIGAAKECLEEGNKGKGSKKKRKLFKVEILDLDAGKVKDRGQKGKKGTGKAKKGKKVPHNFPQADSLTFTIK